jgi:hypothetical protein
MRFNFSAEKNRRNIPVLLGFFILGARAAGQDLPAAMPQSVKGEL